MPCTGGQDSQDSVCQDNERIISKMLFLLINLITKMSDLAKILEVWNKLNCCKTKASILTSPPPLFCNTIVFREVFPIHVFEANPQLFLSFHPCYKLYSTNLLFQHGNSWLIDTLHAHKANIWILWLHSSNDSTQPLRLLFPKVSETPPLSVDKRSSIHWSVVDPLGLLVKDNYASSSNFLTIIWWIF